MYFGKLEKIKRFLILMKRNNKGTLSNINKNDSILNYFKRLRDSYVDPNEKKQITETKLKCKNENINILPTDQNLKSSQKLDLISTEFRAKQFPPLLLSTREFSDSCKPITFSTKSHSVIRCTIVDYFKRDNVTHLRLSNDLTKYTFEGLIPNCQYKITKEMQVVVLGTVNDQGIMDLSYDSGNHIILYPSRVISITNIATATKCLRQAYLNEICAGLTIPNLSMLVGSVGHCLLQFILAKSMIESETSSVVFPTIDELRNHAKIFLESENMVQSLFAGNIECNAVLTNMEEYYEPILEWSNKILCTEFNPSKSLIINDCMVKLKICAIEDYIEDNIYGLKGRIDISCQVVDVQSLKPNIKPCLQIDDMLPIEIKTGRVFSNGNLEHRAQTMMYCMGLSNRYDTKIRNSLLLYVKSKTSPVLVTMGENDMKAFIDKRNSLVDLLENLAKPIPDFAVSSEACRFCPMINVCHLHALCSKTPHPHAKKFPSTLTCSNQEVEFFKNWYSETLTEVSHSTKNRSTSEDDVSDAENNVIKSLKFSSQEMAGSGWFLSFERNEIADRISVYSAFSNRSTILPGCAVIGKLSLNQSNNTNAKFMGFVHSVDPRKGAIIIRMENPLSEEFLGSTFDINLMITNSVSMLPLSFLTQFFVDPAPTVSNLRSIIVNKSPPKINDKYSQEDAEILKDIESISDFTISKSQLNAINHCLKAQDYALLWGLPGTGKTTTIATLLYLLNKSNKRVLVTSHTNAAVDNILLKLLQLKVSFLRIGKASSVHNQIAEFTLEKILKTKTSWEKTVFEALISKHNIIATTCLGTKSSLFERLKYFDVCIVDEATQVHLPLLLGSLMLSTSFILVGDHHQMSPLTLAPKVVLMKKSLFEEMLERNESSVVSLNKQFRMHPSISELSSNMFYNGRLKPDDSALSNLEKKLELDKWDQCVFTDSNEWIKNVLDPETSYPVVFVDHSYILHCKINNSSNNYCINNHEAAAVVELVHFLTKAGMKQTEIGVLSMYGAQASHIKAQLLYDYSDVEVHTVDRFQGRDKECIILSLVSNRSFSETSILGNYKRLNVALTRARKKLIIIGNYRVIGQNKNFNELLEILMNRKAMLYK